MSTPEIRPATEADLPFVTEIYEHAVRYGTATFELIPPDLAEMTRRFRALIDGGFPYFVAAVEGRVIGYAYAGPYRPRPAYRFTVENSIYVAGDARGKGAGSALLAALVDAARAQGKHMMVAGIEAGNDVSLRLHAKQGFVETARMPELGFKFGRYLDLVFLQKTLD